MEVEDRKSAEHIRLEFGQFMGLHGFVWLIMATYSAGGQIIFA